MKRRNFLKNTLIGSWMIPAITVSSCTQATEDATSGEANSLSDALLPNDSFELNEVTVKILQQKMESGEFTAEQITQLYLDRIEAIDKNGPKLNAVLEVNPEALSIAKSLDEERSAGNVRGPLHGIPVLIKDNIDTADQMMTTAGALAMMGNIAQKDAYIVKKLREAGVVLLGKTNLSEWANFRSTRSSSGWSSRGGQCHNPYILDRNPCGSSSGSGIAASANLCAIAIGTETNGSIVCPSSANGLVGIKPTVGLWSRSGIIPISFTQDTAGPMARTVADAATLLGACTGVDANDSKTANSQGKFYQDYTQFLEAEALNGPRIGIMRPYMGFHEEVDAELESAFEAMRKKGATLVEIDEEPAEWKGLGAAGYEVLLYEFKDGVNKYLKTASPDSAVKTVKDIIEFNKANADKAMPYFKQEILEEAAKRGNLNTQEYKDFVAKTVSQSRKGIDRLLRELNIQAIVAPTGGPAWCTNLINGDHFGGGSSSPAARAGYPNISVPAGFVHGLPIGLSFFGTAFSEPTLIKLVYAFEQATKLRKAPEFAASLSAM